MRAALVAGQSVDLVDDDRPHACEHLPAAGRGEQQIERLGVVTTISGRLRNIAERSEAGVSPLRTATCTAGGSSPSSLATSAISERGLLRFSLTSTVKARKGETYTTSVPRRSPPEDAAL